VPKAADGLWVHSENFTADAMAEGFAGDLWVDLGYGLVYLSVSST